jgi:hypothetical protein
VGAQEGQLLGSVPSDVVKNAVCDVLVVHLPAEAFADGTDRVAGADPAGWPLTG